jgi:hypothetical protein
VAVADPRRVTIRELGRALRTDSIIEDREVCLEGARSRVRSQHYIEWREEQEIALPGVFPSHPNWYIQNAPFSQQSLTVLILRPNSTICLEVIEDKADISGLPCLHVFHKACIAGWFTRWHYDCPLCKREVFDQSPTCFKAMVAYIVPPPAAFIP